MAAASHSYQPGGRRRGGPSIPLTSPRRRGPTSARRRTATASRTPSLALMALFVVVHHHNAMTRAFTSTQLPAGTTSTAKGGRDAPLALSATRMPLRKAGSLFGLGDGSLSSKGGTGGTGKEREWPVKVVNSTDGTGKVTIIDRSGGTDDNATEGGVDDRWDAAVMEEQEAELAVFAGGEVQLALEEEDVEEIAGMLVEKPPTLRQLRGSAVGAEKESVNETIDDAKLLSEGDDGDQGISLDGGISSLTDKRAKIKAKAAALEEQKDAEIEMEKKEDEEALPEVEAVVSDASSESLSPTRSIEEDYRALIPGKEESEGIGNDGPTRDELEGLMYGGSDDGKATLSSDDASSDSQPSPTAETPGEKLMKQYESIDVSSSAISETMTGDVGVDGLDNATIASVTDVEATEPKAEITDAATIVNEQDDPDTVSEGGNPPVVEAFGSMLDKAKSFFPAPPEDPPTHHNIDHNHDATQDNLSEINAQLQTTLADQREDLGKLRKKIHELERELLRASRTKDKEMKKELEERTTSLREEYDRQLARAMETIDALETEGRALNEELAEGRTRLEEALEAKERVAAEYSYVVNSYTRLKGSVDSQLTGSSEVLDEYRVKMASLEAQLSNATEQVERYQLESKRWREECTNKANQLDLFTSRVRDMQGTIDTLQTGILDTQKNLDQIIATAKEEEKMRSKGNLQRLSDEYEVLLNKKSKKIGELRTALRSANAKKRRVERSADKERAAAVKEVRDELTAEIEALEGTLKEREAEIRSMEGAMAESMGAKEEKEQLLAEIMFLTKSFEELQEELATNAESYEDCIKSFEKEAAEKDERIRELEEELEVANEKICRLESQIEELTTELEKERSINANLTATVSDLQSELEVAGKNAGGYDDVVAILRKEAESYKTELSAAKEETESLRQKKIDLEELMSRTKDSLVSERQRVADAMEEKDTQIAKLDRELAEKLNEIHSSKAELKETSAELQVMTGNYKGEKSRADALEEKIQKLNRLTGSVNNVESSGEVDRLTKLLEDISKSNDEYKSLAATYEERVKFLSQQLLLSGQNLSHKQSRIANLKRELSETMSKVEDKTEARSSTSDEASALRAKLDEEQAKSTVWKAQANGMIVQLTSDLREKEASMLELQKRLDTGGKEERPNIAGNNDALLEEIEGLKSAMEEAHLKSKEKMKHKNQSLKEMEDTVAKLNAEVNDMKREKEQMADRLNNELRRGEVDFTSHEQQLRQTEDRLAKEHLAAMTKLEDEMHETISQLQSEIQSLKNKAAQGAEPVTNAQNKKMQQIEDALRRSKDKEVSLINDNMKMQHKIQELRMQAEKRSSVPAPADVMDDDSEGSSTEEKPVELPTYYKEKQRPVVVRVVGKAWRKLFRRKKL